MNDSNTPSQEQRGDYHPGERQPAPISAARSEITASWPWSDREVNEPLTLRAAPDTREPAVPHDDDGKGRYAPLAKRLQEILNRDSHAAALVPAIPGRYHEDRYSFAQGRCRKLGSSGDRQRSSARMNARQS